MAPPLTFALHAVGFPVERLVSLSTALGVPVWHPDGDRASGARVVLLLGPTWEAEATSFIPPYSAWIEVAALADSVLLDLMRRAATSEFFASFTTLTANRIDLAGDFLLAITSRRPLPDDSRENIELALHEALCNAVLHGNLQLESIGELSIGALERFSGNFSQRLADPDFANRRIEIACAFDSEAMTIDVADQGDGFTPKPCCEHKASGRGLELISVSCQSYRLLEGGRRLSMRFPV